MAVASLWLMEHLLVVPMLKNILVLGAQCTLAGRHFVRAAHGGLADGVALFANKIKNELAVAMVLTGAQTVKDINRNMVVIPD